MSICKSLVGPREADSSRWILFLCLMTLLSLPLAVHAEAYRVVPAEEILKKIEQGQPVEYGNITLVGDMKINGLKLPKLPVKRGLQVKDHWLPRNETFISSSIIITNSNILGAVDFKSAHLQKKVRFTGSVFEGPVVIRGSIFHDVAEFDDTIFNHTVDLYGTNFNKRVTFAQAQFNHDACFEEAKFNQEVNFIETNFKGTATFYETLFNGCSDFWFTQFNRTANFNYADFNKTVVFYGSNFNETVEFIMARFSQWVHFKNVQFNQTADFSSSQFNWTAEFDDAQFNQEVRFEDAKFLDVSFNNSLFSKDPFFDNAQINGTLSLYRTKYDKLNIRWSSIRDLYYDDTAYYLLIENFKKLGFIDDASECYYSYRCKHQGELLRQGKLDNWFFDLLAWATNGYGLRPVRPLGWSVLFILLGGAFFFVTKSIIRSKGPEPSGNRLRAIRGKEIPQRVNEVSIWEALLLSATYFTSGASAIISATPMEFSPMGKARYVVVLLRLLGWIFFVIFLSSLTRTI